MKSFVFRDVTMKGFMVHVSINNRWTNIIHDNDIVGLCYEEVFTPKGLAPYRVAILILLYGAVKTTHVFKNRFKSLEDAKNWALEKQEAIFDQYNICKV